MFTRKYKCLEWLLTESGVDKASVKEACDHVCTVKSPGGGLKKCLATQAACDARDWKSLDLLVRLGGASVTVPRPDSPFPPIYRHLGLKHCPDRRLKALIESAAKRELELQRVEGKAKSVGAATNSFEDPTTKVLTAAEEKKTAKKQEAKKKAEAKKKVAASNSEMLALARQWYRRRRGRHG
jgi:hypothetical protein